MLSHEMAPPLAERRGGAESAKNLAVEKLDGHRNWMVGKTRRTLESRGKPADGGLRWSVERRLAFIEERLFWVGEVNRGDLVGRFGVSESQASKDIARYLELAPAGLSYDKSAKRYVAGDDFRPALAPPDAVRFLGELRLAELGIVPVDVTLSGAGIPFDTAPLPERAVDAYVLRVLLIAIRDRRALSVTYQSMSREEPMRRVLIPHALAFDGFRWHVRAYDLESGGFRDFVIGRISKPKGDRAAPHPAESDADWFSFVDLLVGPHPGLTAAQKRAISIDYGIVRGASRLKVRRALLFYALKRLGLDVPPDTRPPNEQHIVLLNRDEVLKAASPPAET